MKDYILTVGLEIHAELSTQTKMFCNSKNDPDEKKPNVNVCPVCLGYPGTLPVVNREAVRQVLRLGLAVGGKIAELAEFDRKNYFYPDIPKGYQISQYKYPLVSGGELAGVSLTRIHLEEDTAKSIHTEGGESLLDFNRAGVPLLELVTEPVIHEPEIAARFAREFQLLLTNLGVSNANMEKGEMRVEANVSVSKSNEKGMKVEVKNLNSFKSVEKAVRYEFERQINVLEKGDEVVLETRGWDEVREETVSQRAKEESHDYRYFPDPDLPKLSIKHIPEFATEILKASLPELPWKKRERYKRDFELKDSDIEIYINEPEWGRLLEETAKILNDIGLIKLASNYITSDLKTLIPAENLATVIRMVSNGTISSRGAKEILKTMQIEGGDPELIAKDRNLVQSSSTDELQKIALKIIEENNAAVIEYKKGKIASLQFMIGQAMKETKGNANPQILKEIFLKIL